MSDGSDKPEMPQALKELGETAIRRHHKRRATPALKITREKGTWWFGSPYADADEDCWVALLFDAFGTRSQSTFRTFMCQLSELCSNEWNEDANTWHPAEDELVAAVQIVRSTKPRNEAEACLAAQMVAVHLMQMKVSSQALKGWPEPRTCATAGKLARTYAMQLEAMAKLKGRGSRQRITVRKYSQHEHRHIHLHQGEVENGDQPHEPSRSGRPERETPRELESSAALSCPNSTRNALPMPSDQDSQAVSTARRCRRIRRTDG